ncbi:sensor domain-containing diguanylate cyclase [Cryobacterium sp. CG_9.6]|uniref:sensor domain-containing diguanylate cyclase n=1 Tax=Cryobacterium sp. CG_9.6 TaxID=2760710 RepID=UPI002472F4CF|nr:sensor domain-containing diguanylate cyclase [Cryobacterium sp. CG_9.6]MDH6237265.1 diguanylate cyclase (GGDEF)-like protein [Cryobacterium sp. CG_9.6]
MAAAVDLSAQEAVLPDAVITGVRDPRRMKAVVEADLERTAETDLDAVIATLRLACAVPVVVVNIVTADRQTYVAEVGVGAACTLFADEVSFCAEVVNTGRALTVSDAASHPLYSLNPLVLSGAIGSYAGVPLIDNGVVLGTVALFDDRARTFSADELEILRHQGKLAGSVLALRRSARMDALTGLPNRVLYGDRLSGALTRLERNDGMVCVMYLDIDDFKIINDTYGHGRGDDILVELGKRVSGVLRTTDTVARFGGDEFVILCEDIGSVVEAEEMAARVVAAAGQPWEIRGQIIPVHVSIGFTVTDSADAEGSALLHEADDALYLAKTTSGSVAVLGPNRS